MTPVGQQSPHARPISCPNGRASRSRILASRGMEAKVIGCRLRLVSRFTGIWKDIADYAKWVLRLARWSFQLLEQSKQGQDYGARSIPGRPAARLDGRFDVHQHARPTGFWSESDVQDGFCTRMVQTPIARTRETTRRRRVAVGVR